MHKKMKDKKQSLKNEINKIRLKEFAQTGNFEVYFDEGSKYPKAIGLKYGEGKYMETLGFSRKEQIKYLDFMQDNPKLLKKILGI